jgi:hypothetical protein
MTRHPKVVKFKLTRYAQGKFQAEVGGTDAGAAVPWDNR